MNPPIYISKNSIEKIIQAFALALIRWYQKILSPDHGIFSYRYPVGYCRYYPTCSEYARQSIYARGVSRGIWVSLWRVIRCHPFAAGGYDPVIPSLAALPKTKH